MLVHCLSGRQTRPQQCCRSLAAALASATWLDSTVQVTVSKQLRLSCTVTVTVHFWATVCKTIRPMLSDRCLSLRSVTLLYCGQTVGWIKMKLGVQVGLGPGHNVLDGNPAPPSRKGAQFSPNFRPMSVVAKRLDESRCHLVGR